jgi:hypothetical protein
VSGAGLDVHVVWVSEVQKVRSAMLAKRYKNTLFFYSIEVPVTSRPGPREDISRLLG